MRRPGHPSRARWPVSALLTAPLACLTLFFAARAGAQCPADTMFCSPSGTVVSMSPADSVCGGAVSYNLVTGRFAAEGGGGDLGGLGRVIAWDEYRVVGPPNGTPLAFEGRLKVLGNASAFCAPFAGAGFTATLQEGTSNSISVAASEYQCSGHVHADTTLHLSIVRASGETFSLMFNLSASGNNGGAFITGELSFAGLPPGALVVSCQGFHQDAPVPVRSTSWGTLKQRYR